jgi:MFS family permease
VVAATLTFGAGTVALALLVDHAPAAGVALVLVPALFVIGAGSGAIITPNQALTLMEVDPAIGSTAGGVLQTAQRIGIAVGQAVIGAVIFASLGTYGANAARYRDALDSAVVAALGFVALAATVGVVDLARTRRRTREGAARPPQPDR